MANVELLEFIFTGKYISQIISPFVITFKQKRPEE